jgi:hypothetical protein
VRLWGWATNEWAKPRMGDRSGVLTGGPPQDLNFKHKLKFCVGSNLVQTLSSKAQKNGIKYLEIGFEVRNNFGYCDFPRFKFKFEFKIQGTKRVVDFFWDLIKIFQGFEFEVSYVYCCGKLFPLHLVPFKIISWVYC